MAPQPRQSQRPPRRRTSSSSGAVMLRARSMALLAFARASSRATACARLRGKPSSTKPAAASGPPMRSTSMRMTSSSGTRAPSSMYFFAVRPSTVPAAPASRSMSPVETCSQPLRSARMLACVPLPVPGAPRRIRYKKRPFAEQAVQAAAPPDGGTGGYPPRIQCLPSPDEPGVVAHQQLRLQLLHRVQGDAAADEQAGAADRQRLHARKCRREVGHDGDEAQEDGAGGRDPEEHARQVVVRRAAGTDARYEAALLLQVLRQVLLRVRDDGVEIRESHDEEEDDEVIGHVLLPEDALQRAANVV